MRISNNSVNETSINQNFQVRTNRARAVRKDFDAVRVELSQRAMLSDEYNREENSFPIHNPDALLYTKQMRVIYRYD